MAEARPVFISLDGSNAAESAIPFAAEMSRFYDAPLHFVHVAEGATVSAQDLVNITQWFTGYAAKEAEKVGLKPGAFESRVLTGNAAEALVAAGAEASFMVIASHGRSGLRATVVGSVADKVVRNAPVPIIFVPVETKASSVAAGPSLVGLDGSPNAEAGLALARELATKSGAKLVLLQAYNPVPPVAAEYAVYPLDLAKSLEESATAYLKGIAKEGETAVIGAGPADMVIEEEADRRSAGLIVLTSEGKGLAKRIAFGSITDRIMHSTKRPLLIVPGKAS